MLFRYKISTLALTPTLTLTFTLTLTGNDAQADLSQCVSAAKVVLNRPFDDYKAVATVDGCDYFSYTVYSCEKGRLKPTTTLHPNPNPKS